MSTLSEARRKSLKDKLLEVEVAKEEVIIKEAELKDEEEKVKKVKKVK